MKTRPLGASGIEATVIGLGTWAIGGWMWGGTEEKASIAAIQAGIDHGITLIDTAPAYGLGYAEEIVGKAIAGRRDQVIVATKCGLAWHTAKGTHFFNENGKPVHRYLGAESVRYETEQSLKRLKIDCIDLMQTHWQDHTTPIAETMSALMDLKREGKIRAIGVSNATVAQMEEYRQAGQLDTDQEKYSMLDRQLEKEILPYCLKHNIAMLAYSPLALGALSGKIGPDRKFSGDDQRISDPRFSVENRKKIMALLNEFKPFAAKYGLTIAQLVIAWTIAQPGLTHALAGARNPEQAIENAKAGEVTLAAEDIQAINQILAARGPGIQ
ncbi:MAG: aldo/keto reductase [bacterium]